MPTTTTWPEPFTFLLANIGRPVEVTVSGEQGLIIEGLAMLDGYNDVAPGRLPTTAWLDLVVNRNAPPWRLWLPLADCVGVETVNEGDGVLIGFVGGVSYTLRSLV
jgi:hypothetical protein